MTQRQQYNATIQYDSHAQVDAQLLTALNGYSPATGRDDVGRVQVTITLSATSLAQAAQAALYVAGSVHTAPVASVDVMTTEEFDRRVPGDVGHDACARLAERGRQLASEREDLIAAGVDPQELPVPLRPQCRCITPEHHA